MGLAAEWEHCKLIQVFHFPETRSPICQKKLKQIDFETYPYSFTALYTRKNALLRVPWSCLLLKEDEWGLWLIFTSLAKACPVLCLVLDPYLKPPAAFQHKQKGLENWFGNAEPSKWPVQIPVVLLWYRRSPKTSETSEPRCYSLSVRRQKCDRYSQNANFVLLLSTTIGC